MGEQQLPEESGDIYLAGFGGDGDPSDSDLMRALLVDMTDEQRRAFLAPVVAALDYKNEDDARNVSLAKRLRSHLGGYCGWRGYFLQSYQLDYRPIPQSADRP